MLCWVFTTENTYYRELISLNWFTVNLPTKKCSQLHKARWSDNWLVKFWVLRWLIVSTFDRSPFDLFRLSIVSNLWSIRSHSIDEGMVNSCACISSIWIMSCFIQLRTLNIYMVLLTVRFYFLRLCVSHSTLDTKRSRWNIKLNIKYFEHVDLYQTFLNVREGHFCLSFDFIYCIALVCVSPMTLLTNWFLPCLPWLLLLIMTGYKRPWDVSSVK